MNKEGCLLVGVLVALITIGGLNGEIIGWTTPGPGSMTGSGPIEITEKIAENSISPGGKIFTATATTNETDKAISYSLIENPNDVGVIVLSTGIISVAEGKTLDFENGEKHVFQVVATDAGNAKGTSTITLTLVDEQVIFDQPSYAACVPINSPMGTYVITVSAREGSNTDLNYTIEGANNGVFNIASPSGDITVKQSVDELKTYNLIVQASAIPSSGNPPDRANVSVTVDVQTNCQPSSTQPPTTQPPTTTKLSTSQTTNTTGGGSGGNSAAFYPSVAVLIIALLVQTLQ